MTLYPEENAVINPELTPVNSGESVTPQVSPGLSKAHVQTLPPMDYANPNKYNLPAPPAGLTWVYMSQCWPRHDIIRVNGLS